MSAPVATGEPARTEEAERRDRRRRRLLRALSYAVALLGLAWFGWIVARTGALEELVRRLPLFAVMLPAWSTMPLCCTLSWAYAFPRVPGSRRPGFGRLWLVRTAGEAVNNLLLSAYVAGEPVKGLLVARHGVTPAVGIAAAVVGKTTFTIGEMLFVALGAGAAAYALRAADAVALSLLGVAAAGTLVSLAAVWLQRRRLFARGARLARSLRLGPRALWERALPAAEAVDAAAERYYAAQRRDFLVSVLLAGLGWTLGALELVVYFLATGEAEHPVATALAVEAGIAVAKGMSFFVPGSIGVQETATTWLFRAFGLEAESGAVYAVLRRLRELTWNAAGLALLAWQLRSAAAPPAPAPGEAPPRS